MVDVTDTAFKLFRRYGLLAEMLQDNQRTAVSN